MQRFIFLGLVAAALILVTGTLLEPVLHPKPTAALAAELHFAGRVLTVDGSTDLPGGTVITYSVWHELMDQTLRSAEAADAILSYVPPPYETYATTAVRDGHFKFVLDLTSWPAGSITVWAAFEPSADQPPETVARFGSYGERLAGPAVVRDSDGRRLVWHTQVELPAPR